MSVARQGFKLSPESIAKTRDAHIGSKRSDDSRMKMRKASRNREVLRCSHCDKEMMPGNYHRWHGDNCKMQLNDVP